LVKTTQLTKRVWLMDDNGESSGYVILGSEKALVIDTMNGHEDIKKVVETITDLPLILVNTHVHPDHIGGNRYFEEAYINQRDWPFVEKFTFGQYEKDKPKLKPVNNGDTFSLGDVTVEAYEMPGHTPGEICLLLPDEKILFTGDGINRHLWMQLEDCCSLEEYLETLDQIEPVVKRADYILHGHVRSLENISLYYDMKNALRDLVEQKNLEVTEKDGPYNWFGGVAKIHIWDEMGSAICYQENNIKKK